MIKGISFFLIFLVLASAVAALVLPEGISKIKEHNAQQAEFFKANLSVFIAFLAGILSLLSPCILPLVPAFFAYTFQERKQISKMTFFFFLGFTLVFIVLGILAAALGKSLTVLKEDYGLWILVSGVLLIVFGIMTIFGRGFTLLKVKSKARHNALGIFIFGILFGLGWTACLGPVLSGVLLMASLFHNYLQAVLILFSYSLGIFVPLFVLAFFFDKYKIHEWKLVKGKEFQIFGRNIHSTSLASGLLLIVIGITFIIYRGTGIVNTVDPIGLKQYFYIFQDKLIEIPLLANAVGIVVALIFLFFLWRILRKK